jgi:hypothetical protein
MTARVALTCIALATLAAACSSSGSGAAKDVTVTSCDSSPSGGHPRASGQITNHSSKDSAYVIHVRFTDASGNGVGDGVATVAKVAPSGTASWHADDVTSAKGPVSCKVSSVTRTVSV